MAKQKDKKEQQTIEPVTNYDHLEKSERILSVHDIEKMIVTLRGVQVMIDRDLAFLYQVEVKQMNRQVKRNIERFPEDFMFQLTKEEYASLKCHFGTSNERGGDRRALPYAFTQQGIGMLSGLLRSKVAIETNIKIMRAFVGMQRYIAASMQIFQRLKFVQLPHRNHDRFLIIDDKVHFLGASLKDMGEGLCAVTEMTTTPETILSLLK